MIVLCLKTTSCLPESPQDSYEWTKSIDGSRKRDEAEHRLLSLLNGGEIKFRFFLKLINTSPQIEKRQASRFIGGCRIKCFVTVVPDWENFFSQSKAWVHEKEVSFGIIAVCLEFFQRIVELCFKKKTCLVKI